MERLEVLAKVLEKPVEHLAKCASMSFANTAHIYVVDLEKNEEQQYFVLSVKEIEDLVGGQLKQVLWDVVKAGFFEQKPGTFLLPTCFKDAQKKLSEKFLSQFNGVLFYLQQAAKHGPGWSLGDRIGQVGEFSVILIPEIKVAEEQEENKEPESSE